MTSKEALEELRFQVGNITYFTHYTEGILRMATYKVRDSGLFETIEKDLNDFEWLKTKLNLAFLESLGCVEDKIKVLKIMGISMGEWLENE